MTLSTITKLINESLDSHKLLRHFLGDAEVQGRNVNILITQILLSTTEEYEAKSPEES